jgi:hypothetical protein
VEGRIIGQNGLKNFTGGIFFLLAKTFPKPLRVSRENFCPSLERITQSADNNSDGSTVSNEHFLKESKMSCGKCGPKMATKKKAVKKVAKKKVAKKKVAKKK